jgi:signal-transduction protein with cAMP-binding, CBS, and nucleotidyltransferase domain
MKKKPHSGIAKKRIQDVMQAVGDGLHEGPSVAPEDRIIDVIEFMLKKNLKEISVVQKGKSLGVVRLEDLLEEMGLYHRVCGEGE